MSDVGGLVTAEEGAIAGASGDEDEDEDWDEEVVVVVVDGEVVSGSGLPCRRRTWRAVSAYYERARLDWGRDA